MSTVDPKQPAAAPIGRVISVRGSQASVGLPAPHPRFSDDTRATVGKFLGIDIGKAILIGVITDVFIESIPAGKRAGLPRHRAPRPGRRDQGRTYAFGASSSAA